MVFHSNSGSIHEPPPNKEAKGVVWGVGLLSGPSQICTHRILQTSSELTGRPILQLLAAFALVSLLSVTAPLHAQELSSDRGGSSGNLKELSLDQLGNVRVTTVSK